GRIIPVHRKQDVGEGADPAKNREMFEAAARVLSRGRSIAIFPEGQSHTEPMLQPLKTGAARMALSGPIGLRILPVGIAFDRRYDRLLARLGLSDADVRSRFGAGSVVRWTLRFVHRVLLRTPTGLMGTLLHAIPYRIPRRIAQRHAKEIDQPASWKLFIAVV